MIRQAVISDLDDIERIEIASFAEPWSRPSIEVEFYKDYSKFFVYDVDGIIAGYIIIWNLGPESELVTIAVSDKFRCCGIGYKLLNHVIGLVGVDVIWRLEVDCSNKAAIHLYEKFGFVETGVIKNYYGQDRNAFRMLRETGS